MGLRWSWWPSEPDFQTQLLSDFGISSSSLEIESEFQEEILAIKKALDELGHVSESADYWQKGKSDAGHRLMLGLSQLAEALNVWDEIGVPIRRRGDIVFRIRAQRDVLGSPIISALPVDFYVRCVSQKTAEDAIEIAQLRKHLAWWRVGTILCTIVFVLILVRIL